MIISDSYIGVGIWGKSGQSWDYKNRVQLLQTKDQMTSTMGIPIKLCFHDITCRGKP